MFFLAIFGTYYLLATVRAQNLSKTELNTGFTNRRINRPSMGTYSVQSKLACSSSCAKTPACLSYQYNTNTEKCVLYSVLFGDKNAVATTSENGWSYYCKLAGIYQKECFRFQEPACNHLCLKPLVSCTSLSYTTAQKICNEHNGEVIKVDNKDTNLCLEELLDQMPFSLVYFQGKGNLTTGLWYYDDGTEFTGEYDDWDSDQPDNKRGDEIRIATFKPRNNRWHDISDNFPKGAVCQIY